MELDTDFIKLDSFLKMASIVGSGGEAKMLITSGEVRVNGETELRRGRKLYPGDRVEIGGAAFAITGAGQITGPE